MGSLTDLESRFLTYYVETHIYSYVNQICTNIEYENYEPYYDSMGTDLIANRIHDTILSLQVF